METKPVDVAFLILNSQYKCKKRLCKTKCKCKQKFKDLPGVKSDGHKMKKMLSSYKIKSKENSEDIPATLKQFLVEVKGEKVRRCHFHFSGHGVFNEEKNNKWKAEVGQCIVGSSGELFSETDPKNSLLECHPDKITITYDCCRG